MKDIFILFITLLAFDYIYFSIFGSKLVKMIEAVQKDKIKLNYYSLIFCYLVMSIGINYFIVQKSNSVKDAFLLGLFVYSVYELTSYTTFINWPLHIVFLDSLWGGCLFALCVSLLKYF